MKAGKIFLLLTLICCFTHTLKAQNISVDDSKTAQELVQNVLVNSPCANVSNFAVSGDTRSSGKNSYGYFNSASSSFPFSEGIVLSTWSAKNSEGPFMTNQGGGDKLWTGDTDLEQTLGLTKTINATTLEFDFTPLTNFLSFKYIFASNEYQIYFPCVYSDGFAFLIKEKGTSDPYKNLAVLPGTNTPVSSKNVHPTISPYTQPGGTTTIPGCPAINESYFNGFNSASSPTNYAGQTKVMTAQTNVIAGKTYHIKLVIADDKNEYYDSAVFLQAGSFAQKIDLGSDHTSSANNPICYGETLLIDTKLPSSYTYKWFKNNVAILGQTTPTYTITDAGTYRVEATLTPSICIATGEIKVEYAPQIILNNAILKQCDDDGDGRTVFDLTKLDNFIKGNNANLNPLVYYTSLADAQAQQNSITKPESFTNTTPNQTIFVRATNPFGCANYASVQLLIPNNAVTPPPPISVCDTDASQDGITVFNLNNQVTPTILGGLPNGITIEYYLNTNDAIIQKNPLANNFTNTIAHQQVIYTRISNGSDCYSIIPVTLVVNTFYPPNFQDENVFLCNGSTINLSVNTGFKKYNWNTGSVSNSISVTNPGNYSVKVTDSNGCEKMKNFMVSESNIATITNAVVNDFSGNENSVTLQFNGKGNYEFSLDGTNFQPEPLFTGIAPGIYYGYVNDKNGCGLSLPYRFYVLDYPRFFTPNDDGHNDIWEIKNLDQLPISTITIFDRYGKLLKVINSNTAGWNGTYNGYDLPTSDYWFNVKFQDGKVIKGHFSLKR